MLAPETHVTGMVTESSNVFALGMVLLSIVTLDAPSVLAGAIKSG